MIQRIRIRTGRATPIAAIVLACTPAVATAQVVYEWATPFDGRFDVEANWSPIGLPGPGDTSILGGAEPYVVTIDGLPMGSPLPYPQVDVLDLANPQAVAFLASNRRFGLVTLRGAGELQVAASERGQDTTVFVVGGGEVAGTVRLFRGSSASEASRLVNEDFSTPVVITETGLITGGGSVDGVFLSRGVIEASGEDPRIRLGGVFTQTDGGVIRGGATDGFIRIDTLAPTHIIGGRVELPEGGYFSPNGSTLTGVAITSGTVVAAGLDALNTTLIDCTINGRWGMRNSGRFTVEGSLTGDATIVVNDDGGTASTTIQLFGDASIGIRVELNSVAAAGLIQYRTGVGNITPEGVVTGRGGVYGRIHNEGVIEAPGPDGFISFPQEAIITQADTGEIRAMGGTISLIAADLRGGRWVAGSGVAVGTVKGGTISDAMFAGQWNIVEGTSATIAGEITSDPDVPGVFVVNSGGVDRLTILWVEPASVMNASVSLNMPDGGRTSAASIRMRGVGEPVTFGAEGVVRGQGLLRFGDFVNGGLLSPNGHADLNSPGVIEVSDATLECGPGSRVAIDVLGSHSSMHDRIGGDGGITLDGTLEVRFTGGYEPDASDRYTVVRGGSVAGKFFTLDVQPAGAVAEIGPPHVVYSADEATLVLCAADRNGDGVLDVFDFMAFQDQFIAGNLQADLDSDGRLTIFDFLVFQDRFIRGC